MKRFITAFAVVVLTGVLAAASAEGMQYGVRAGFNMNKLSAEDDLSMDMGTGFGAGFVMKYPLANRLNIVPEVNLLHRTLGKYEFGFFDLPVKFTISESVLSIPCMIQYQISESQPFYLSGGIQLDIPFGTKMKMTVSGFSDSESISDLRSSIDFGIPLGFGYMINPNMIVDFRFVPYLTNIYKEGDSDVSLMSFSFGFNYFF